MNTGEIYKVLITIIPDSFVGVFSSNKIPVIAQYPTALVANTDPSHEPGSHWVAILFLNPFETEYFCSYGQKPKSPGLKKVLKGLKVKYNEKRLQGDYSSVCGQYSIYFLIKRNQGLTMEEIADQFSKNLFENDKLIKCYVNDNFDLETVQYDLGFLEQQICKALCS